MCREHESELQEKDVIHKTNLETKKLKKLANAFSCHSNINRSKCNYFSLAAIFKVIQFLFILLSFKEV